MNAEHITKEEPTKIFREYQRPLTRYLILRTKNETLSQDLVQDVFLNILKSLQNGNIIYRESFSGLIWKTTKNVLTSHYRKEIRISKLNLELSEFVSPAEPLDYYDRNLLIRDTLKEGVAAIQEYDIRIIMQLRLLEKRPGNTKEIAGALGVSQRTVERRIDDGMYLLRVYFRCKEVTPKELAPGWNYKISQKITALNTTELVFFRTA